MTGRLSTYVRDDRPFGGSDPPAAVFFASRDRTGLHPETHLAGYAGIMQADAYAGFNRLYEPDRKPGPIVEAGCFAGAQRKLFDLAKVAGLRPQAGALGTPEPLFAVTHSFCEAAKGKPTTGIQLWKVRRSCVAELAAKHRRAIDDLNDLRGCEHVPVTASPAGADMVRLLMRLRIPHKGWGTLRENAIHFQFAYERSDTLRA